MPCKPIAFSPAFRFRFSEADALVVRSRLLTEDAGARGPDTLPDEPAGWSRIVVPGSAAARKISADGDALAVRLADGSGWFLMEQTAPERSLSGFAEPGRAMVYASPDDFKPSVYAELEFAAYGPDAEHAVRFSLPKELP